MGTEPCLPHSLSHPKRSEPAAVTPIGALKASEMKVGTAPPNPVHGPGTGGGPLLPIMWLATWIWISLSLSKVIWHLIHWYVFFCPETGEKGMSQEGEESRKPNLLEAQAQGPPEWAWSPPRSLRAILFPLASEPRSPVWGKGSRGAPQKSCSLLDLESVPHPKEWVHSRTPERRLRGLPCLGVL